MSSNAVVDEFLELRRIAFSTAYRMLGSVTEADDLAQEAIVRLLGARAKSVDIASTEFYIRTTTIRLGIDLLRSARIRRESYVGVWIPEPMVDDGDSDAERRLEIAESVTMAFLFILESLSPIERAVFLMREVFDIGYSEIAHIVEKSEQNCRQIFLRAKNQVDAHKPRFEVNHARLQDLTARFLSVCQSGDVNELFKMLASDVNFYADGGDKAIAILSPLQGPEDVSHHLLTIFYRAKAIGCSPHQVEVNGGPGLMFFDSLGRIVSVTSIHFTGDSIDAVWSIINPDKLTHLGAVSDAARILRLQA